MAFVNSRLALTSPLDISGLDAPHLACSVCRRLVSTYTGPLVRLRRDSDNAESDIGQKGGRLNLEEAFDFVGGGEAFATVVYDQSGNGWHIAESTASAQPPAYDGQWLQSEGFPMAQLGGTFNRRLRVATDNASASGCVALATYINSTPAGQRYLFDDYDSVGDWSAQVDASSRVWTETNGYAAVMSSHTMATLARHILICNFESAPHRHRVLHNGVADDYLYGATGTADGINVGVNGSVANGVLHSFHEIIWYNTQLSDALLDTLSANMNSFYKVY